MKNNLLAFPHILLYKIHIILSQYPWFAPGLGGLAPVPILVQSLLYLNLSSFIFSRNAPGDSSYCCLKRLLKCALSWNPQ